jgi:hypothetical protein
LHEARRHAPVAQDPVPFGIAHGCRHAPQFVFVFSFVSQSGLVVSQFPYPARHAGAVQAPPTHDEVAFATVHDRPHMPQLSWSIILFTQRFPHRSGAVAGHPDVHVGVPPAMLHTGVEPLQTKLHPHFCDTSVSQPSLGFAVQ